MPSNGDDENRSGLSGPVACCLLLLVTLVVVATYLVSVPEAPNQAALESVTNVESALVTRSLAARLGVTALLLTVTGTSVALARSFVASERRVVTTSPEGRSDRTDATRPIRFLACLSGVVLVAVASLIAAIATLFGL